MKKALVCLLILLISGCTVVTSETESSPVIEKNKYYLGYLQDEDGNMVLPLNTDVYLTNVRADLKEEMTDTASSLLFEYHKLLDSHRYYLDEDNNRIPNLKMLNDSFNTEIEVDERLYNAVNEAIEIAELTEGYFNPTIGRVMDLYEDKFLSFDSENTDPEESDMEAALSTVVPYSELRNYIVLNEEKHSITLLTYNDQEYEIDLGAFSKGYVAERIYEELISFHSSFILNCGSSSMITYNEESEEISWSVGAKMPDDNANSLFAFSMNNYSLSTSGDYEQYYFLSDGTRRHHILNPFTGYSENYYREIVLRTGTKAGLIDALTTALYSIEDKEKAIELIGKVEDYYNVDIDYAFVKDGYELFTNKEFYEDYIESYTSNKIINLEVIE